MYFVHQISRNFGAQFAVEATTGNSTFYDTKEKFAVEFIGTTRALSVRIKLKERTTSKHICANILAMGWRLRWVLDVLMKVILFLVQFLSAHSPS